MRLGEWQLATLFLSSLRDATSLQEGGFGKIVIVRVFLLNCYNTSDSRIFALLCCTFEKIVSMNSTRFCSIVSS